jgi:TFIIF-interacting CTD phosphatase-like protein
MSQYFDIVAISDALPQQIDKIIDLLDTKGMIKHRLYKYHMVEEKTTGRYVKSLERIGREMEKVVMIDVEGNRVTEEARNTIFINQWRGSKNDSVLAELCSVLLAIAVNRLDCTKATKKIEAQIKLNLANGIRHINFGLDLKQEKI